MNGRAWRPWSSAGARRESQREGLRESLRDTAGRPGLLGSVAARHWLWPGLLATMAVLTLLTAFHQVVLGGVRQGEIRRQAAAMHADAKWRCQALRGAGLASDCPDGQSGSKDQGGQSGQSGVSGLRVQPGLDRSVPKRPAVLPRQALLADGAATRPAP